MTPEIDQINRLTLAKLMVVSVMMGGFGYAMVPLYYKICQVTGINQLTTADEPTRAQVDSDRIVRFELDATAHGPVVITPESRIVQANPGRARSVVYRISNTSDRRLVGQAVPSYSPAAAGRWIRKLECFCFDRLTLAAGEEVDLPVIFELDPNMPEDVPTVSLSYAFFEVEGAQ